MALSTFDTIFYTALGAANVFFVLLLILLLQEKKPRPRLSGKARSALGRPSLIRPSTSPETGGAQTVSAARGASSPGPGTGSSTASRGPAAKPAPSAPRTKPAEARSTPSGPRVPGPAGKPVAARQATPFEELAKALEDEAEIQVINKIIKEKLRDIDNQFHELSSHLNSAANYFKVLNQYLLDVQKNPEGQEENKPRMTQLVYEISEKLTIMGSFDLERGEDEASKDAHRRFHSWTESMQARVNGIRKQLKL